MNIHKNARLTPLGRERILRQVLSGQALKAVGEAAGVSALDDAELDRLLEAASLEPR